MMLHIHSEITFLTSDARNMRKTVGWVWSPKFAMPAYLEADAQDPVSRMPGSWMQHRGSRILNPLSCFQDSGPLIQDPAYVILEKASSHDPKSSTVDLASWIQDLGSVWIYGAASTISNSRSKMLGAESWSHILGPALRTNIARDASNTQAVAGMYKDTNIGVLGGAISSKSSPCSRGALAAGRPLQQGGTGHTPYTSYI